MKSVKNERQPTEDQINWEVRLGLRKYPKVVEITNIV